MRQLPLCFQLSPLLSLSALSLAWSRESFPFLSPAAKKVVWLQVYQILIYQFKAPLQETEESFVFCGNLDTHEAAKVQMELFLHRGITEGMSEGAIDQSWDAL